MLISVKLEMFSREWGTPTYGCVLCFVAFNKLLSKAEIVKSNSVISST